MSDPIRYAIHIRRLVQIKQRPNQYPTYKHKNLRKSESQVIIKKNELSSEIKNNQKNISSVKKSFERKKPVNYDDDDKYLFDREVEKVQKEMLNSLLIKNQKLKNQLKSLKENYLFYNIRIKK